MVAPELYLKHQTEEQLVLNLLNRPEWTLEDQQAIGAAYDLVKELHAEDTHGGQPYVNHLLRVANRVIGYLEVYDPEIVVAALLHDSVEDHPDTLITRLKGPDAAVPEDLFERKSAALQAVSERFSARTATIVGDVSNDPDLFTTETYEEGLAHYHTKVTNAIMGSPEAAILKFCDWNDNALSDIYRIHTLSPDRIAHSRRKYGALIQVFRERFAQSEMQALLSPVALDYIKQQLDFAEERLLLAA